MFQAPPVEIVEPVQIVQPPPRVVVIRPKVVVAPQQTVVIKKPPIIVHRGCAAYNCVGQRSSFRLPNEASEGYYQSQYSGSYYREGNQFGPADGGVSWDGVEGSGGGSVSGPAGPPGGTVDGGPNGPVNEQYPQ